MRLTASRSSKRHRREAVAYATIDSKKTAAIATALVDNMCVVVRANLAAVARQRSLQMRCSDFGDPCADRKASVGRQ